MILKSGVEAEKLFGSFQQTIKPWASLEEQDLL